MRDRTPSASEIAKEVAAELSGGYAAQQAGYTDPPVVRQLQKYWWRFSLWAIGIVGAHVLHEVIARLTWRR